MFIFDSGELGQSTATATANVNACSGAAMLTPLLGPFIADSCLALSDDHRCFVSLCSGMICFRYFVYLLLLLLSRITAAMHLYLYSPPSSS